MEAENMNTAWRRRLARKGLLLAAICLVGAVAQAQPAAQPRAEPSGFTWGELSLLPEYCRDANGVLYAVSMGGPPGPAQGPRAAYWYAQIGEDFWHFHHLCRGLRDLIRAGSPSNAPQRRRFLQEAAMGEFRYMIKNSSPAMPLMPEIWLKLGETQLLVGDMVGAKTSFETSRDLKPDYWPAYTRWFDFLITLKAFDQARALAQEGLRHAPDSAELKSRLASITGKTEAPSKTRAATSQTNKAERPQ